MTLRAPVVDLHRLKRYRCGVWLSNFRNHKVLRTPCNFHPYYRRVPRGIFTINEPTA